jgi:hypothetical protein
VDGALLVEPAEQALHGALAEVTPLADRLFDAGDLHRLAAGAGRR